MKLLCKRSGKTFTEYKYFAAAFSGDSLPGCPYCGEEGRKNERGGWEMHATPYDSDWEEWHEDLENRRCPTCGSVGFEVSVLGLDRCTFCDGTEGGDPPTAEEINDSNS